MPSALPGCAKQPGQVLVRVERAGMATCAPEINHKSYPKKYLSDKGAPWTKIANEKPNGESICRSLTAERCKAGKLR